MRTPNLIVTSLLLLSATCFAEDAERQAKAFQQIFTSICARNISDLDALRKQLNLLPKLSPEQATGFLNGQAGSAWPVPDDAGLFVVALPDNKNICLVYARRASAATAERDFIALASTAPNPLVARKVSDTIAQSADHGETHTLSYEWQLGDASRKLVFMLTTSTYEKAELQVLGSVSIVSE